MTRQVEQNTLRAVKQLERVEQLSDEERREILGRAFAVDASKTRWTSAVLSRSSFGTSSAWAAISYRGALNLFILRKIVRENRNGESLDLSYVPTAAFRVIAEAIQFSSNGWVERSIDLLDKKIYFPNLHLDNRFLARMIKVEEDSSSAEASPA